MFFVCTTNRLSTTASSGSLRKYNLLRGGPSRLQIYSLRIDVAHGVLCSVCLSMTSSTFWHHFHPWITETMDLGTVSHFATPKHRKIPKWWPKWVAEGSRNDLKLNKNAHLALRVPVGQPFGSLARQNCHSGTQNGAGRSQKSQLWAERVIHFSSQPISNCLLTRGASGRGEALRYIPYRPCVKFTPPPPQCYLQAAHENICENCCGPFALHVKSPSGTITLYLPEPKGDLFGWNAIP